MKNYFNLPISIHCWGGLGSQLFTWAMAEKIAKEYPRRKIKLVLHSSGVTKRDSSVDFLSQKYQIVNINDFQKNERRDNPTPLEKKFGLLIIPTTYISK